MVNKKSKRNNNTTSKKPAPSEGKLITNSDKLIQSISSNTPYYGSKAAKLGNMLVRLINASKN
jgi:hypothetical protein